MLKGRVILVLLLAASTALSFQNAPVKVRAVNGPNPTVFWMLANSGGWNSTVGPANPTVIEFRGVTFTVNVQFDEQFRPGICHDFAIYVGGTTSISAFPNCSLTTCTSSCLAKSLIVSSNNFNDVVKFTPTVPADDFTGPGGYEYFCQYHPTTMHGKFMILKSPDLLNRGTVDIVDIATMAFYFSTTVTASSPATQKASDIDNNGVVNILDIAQAAFYFGQPF